MTSQCSAVDLYLSPEFTQLCVCVCGFDLQALISWFIVCFLFFEGIFWDILLSVSSDYITWCDYGFKPSLFLHLFSPLLWDVCKSGRKRSTITKLCSKCGSWAEIASVLNLWPVEMMWAGSERHAAVQEQQRATVDAWIVNTISIFLSHQMKKIHFCSFLMP